MKKTRGRERTWILVNLLDSAGPRALYSHHCCLSREELFILQVPQSQLLGVINQPSDLQEVVILFDDWDTTVVAHEVIFVPREGCLDEAILRQQFSQVTGYLSRQIADSWRFAVIGKVQHMYHILRLLLLYNIPALFR